MEATATTPSATARRAPVAEPIHVTDADFAAVCFERRHAGVVDLWAEWCGPCHMIAPRCGSWHRAYEGRAVITKLNVDENPNTPGRYGIMGIPTLLYFKDGKEVDRQVSVTNSRNLANKLEKLLD